LHERDPAGSRHAIATIEAVARDTIEEIDRMVSVLRADDATTTAPADPAALDRLVDRHRASGLRIVTDLRGPRARLPRSVAWATYRILQEALTNAARHGCGSALLAVRYGRHDVEITVTNPTAAEPATKSSPGWIGGHGIVGMRERATLLGGTLHADPGPGVFRLHARLPHDQAAP
jgi:signal transduction histidine kinase